MVALVKVFGGGKGGFLGGGHVYLFRVVIVVACLTTPTERIRAGPHTLKGQGHKLTVCEECALIPPVVFYEVVVPTLQLDEAALICISTVRGSQNLFSKMRNLKGSDGEPVFNTIDFRLQCTRPACKLHPEKCNHVLVDLPAHMSATKAKRVQELMQENMELWLQETRGIERDPAEPMFPLRYLERLFDKGNRYTRLKQVQKREIYVNVDPNQGGDANYAVSSFVEAEGYDVLVGVEQRNTKDPDEQRTIIIDHIRTLLERPDLEGCHVVLGVETNSSFIGENHQAYIIDEHLQHRVCMLVDAGKGRATKPGIETTAATKHRMAFLCRWDLQRDRVRIAYDVTCVSGKVDETLRNYFNELTVYSRLVEQPTKPGALPRIIFTGKHAGNTDDAAIAFQLFWLSRSAYHSLDGLCRYNDFHQLSTLPP